MPSLRRPFAPPAAVSPSRYYPYGTTANGTYLLHHGVDIGNPEGTPVLAVADGRVEYAGDDLEMKWGPETEFYGLLVVVRHDEGLGDRDLYSLYGHLRQVTAVTGQRIRAGEEVGRVGATGIALGPHLHLELRTSPRDYDSALNPELFLAPLPDNGTVAGRVVDPQGRPVGGVTVDLYSPSEGGLLWRRATRTYEGDGVGPVPGWNENFVFADLPAGRYALGTDGRPATADTVQDLGPGATLRVVLVVP